MSDTEHPSGDDLFAFLVGTLPEEAAETVCEHVDSCTVCRETLREMDEGQDGLVAKLRERPDEDPYADEPERQQVLDGAKAVVLAEPRSKGASFAAVESSLGQVGQYRLLGKLGEGGMGTVYKALHTKLDKVMALKVLPAERMKKGDAVARFEREMKAVGKLDHPNIVSATDAGEHEGVHFLAMEYVEGIDLASLVKQLGPLPIADACELIRQAAVGLQHAHERGLVHRDIKPSNLMLMVEDRRSRVEGVPSQSAIADRQSAILKILDLGLARLQQEAVEELTSTGQVMGTVDYMAPEQGGHSHDVDLRADIYGLGATLYKLLCGQAPFGDAKYETPMQKLTALATEVVPPIRQRRSEVPDELASILDRMLAKDPADRYTTAAELVQALTPLATGSDLSRLLSRTDQRWSRTETIDGQNRSTDDYVSSAMTGTTPSVQELERSASAPLPAEAGVLGTIGSSEKAHERETQAKPAGPRSPRWFVGLALGGVAAVILGAVIYVQTQYGRLVIDANVDDVKIVVEGHRGVTIIDANTQRTVKLWPGKYDVRLEEQKAGLSLNTKSFTMKRRGEVIVDVRYEPEVAGTQPSKLGFSEETGFLDDAIQWQPGPAENALPGIVPRPATLSGIKRWQVETRLPRHGIRSVALSPDDRLIACGTLTGHVRIYDAKTLKLVRLLLGHTDAVYCVAWSPKGDWLASCGGTDGTVRLWQPDGSVGPVIKMGKIVVTSIGWSPNGEQLVSGSRKGVQIWNRDGSKATDIFPESTQSVAWSPDGQWIAGGDNKGKIRLWKPDESPGPVFEGHERNVECIAWSPDGQRLASASMDCTVRLWNMDGTAGPVLDAPNAWSHCVAWSRDGEHLSSGGMIWKADGKLVHEINPGIGNIWSLDWTSDGKSLILAGDTGLPICAVDGERLRVLPRHFVGDLPSVCWHPEGHQFVRSGFWAGVWSADGKPVTTLLDSGAGPAAWRHDGRQLAVGAGQGTVHLLNHEGKHERQIRIAPSGSIRSISWQPNGNWLAVGCNQGNVRLYDVTGEAGPVLKVEGNYTVVRWSPDGDLLATCGQGDTAIRLWKPDGTLVSMLESQRQVEALAWSPDGNWLAAGSCLFDVHKPEEPIYLFEPEIVRDVGFSPDGDWVATGRNDRSVRLWRVDGSAGPVFRGHKGWYLSIGWSPNGRDLVSTDEAGMVLSWNTETLDPEWVVQQLDDGQSATFTAAGQLKYGDPDVVEREFVYVVETEEGKQETLKPSEFYKRLPKTTSAKETVSEDQPETRVWDLGSEHDALPGIIPRPATPSGRKRWQVETRLPRHGIRSVALSLDDRLIACGTRTGKVRIYDAKTLKLVRLLLGHTDVVSCVAWSPNGDWLASCGEDGTVRLWQPDGSLGPVVKVSKAPCVSIAWSPDGEQLVSGSSDGVQIWNRDGSKAADIFREGTHSVAWSSDGQWIAAGNNKGKIRLWKSDGSPGPVFEGHEDVVNCIAWSPDSQWLASASSDYTVRLWKVDGTAGPVLEAPEGGGCQCVAWSPDGMSLAASTVAVRVWDAEGNLKREIKPHMGAGISSLDWTADSKSLILGGGGLQIYTVDGERLRVVPWRAPSETANLCWHPDGQRFATSWSVFAADGRHLFPLDYAGQVAWRHVGGQLAVGTGQGTVQLLNHEGKRERQIPTPSSHAVRSISWQPNGKWIAAGYLEGNVRLFDVTGQSGSILEVDGTATVVRWRPDGELLATCGQGDTLRLWRPDGTLFRTLDSGNVRDMAWSPDGKWLLADGSLFCVDDPEQRLRIGQNVYAVAFSPDGQRVATGSLDGMVRIWRVDGSAGPVLGGHRRWLTSVDWSPNGKHLLSTDDAGMILSWNTETLDPEWVTQQLNDGQSATFTAAGQLKYGDPHVVEREFVYVVETEEGKLETLKPSEFISRVPEAKP